MARYGASVLLPYNNYALKDEQRECDIGCPLEEALRRAVQLYTAPWGCARGMLLIPLCATRAGHGSSRDQSAGVQTERPRPGPSRQRIIADLMPAVEGGRCCERWSSDISTLSPALSWFQVRLRVLRVLRSQDPRLSITADPLIRSNLYPALSPPSPRPATCSKQSWSLLSRPASAAWRSSTKTQSCRTVPQ